MANGNDSGGFIGQPRTQGGSRRVWRGRLTSLVGLLGLGLSLSGLAHSASIPGPVLSYSEAIAIARDADPRITQRRRLAEAERLAAIRDGSLPEPRLHVEAKNLPVNSFDFDREPLTRGVVALRQDVPAFGRRAARRTAGNAKARAHAAATDTQRAQIERHVADHWLALFELQGRLGFLRERQALYNELEETASGGYQVGRARPSELAAIGLRLSELDEAQEALRGQAADRRAQLARWLGAEAERPLPETLPDRLQKPDAASIRVDRHPELMAIQADRAAAAAQRDEARAAYRPDWTLGVEYSVRAGRADVTSVGITLDLPLFAGTRQDPALEAAQARYDAAGQAQQDTRARLQSEAAAIGARLSTLSERIRTYDEQIIPQRRRLIELSRSEYQTGRGTFADLVEVAAAAIDAEERQFQLRIDRARALVDQRYLQAEYRP
jgi:outer membrane protein TolC